MSKMEVPHSVPIVVPEEGHIFSMNEEAFERFLLQDHLKDCNAVVISVAGAVRKGKSFLLDFFIRYLKFKYSSADHDSNDDAWLKDENSPLNGFSWRGGSDRDTIGILMWSEVFCTTLPSGEKVAIILLDTQGTFDNESTVKDCATIFALSTLLSSVQVYNLFRNIQEDDLQNLQLFAEYGRLALQDTGYIPFQKLLFLVRDWCFPYEASYGFEGGQKILDKKLQISDKQHPELQLLRKHIKSYFTKMQCFLMPSPGKKVATNPEFDGRLADIDSEFKSCLGELVPLLLSPEKLVQKEIGGQKVKVGDLVEYFKSYRDIFNGNELPDPKTIFMITAEANHKLAVAAAKDTYHELMEQVFSDLTTVELTPEQLESNHNRCKDTALQQFIRQRKMGEAEFIEKYRLELEQFIESDYQEYKERNEKIGEANHKLAVAAAKDTYHELMEQVFSDLKTAELTPEQLELNHNRCKDRALEQFKEQRKMGEAEFLEKYPFELEQFIETNYKEYKDRNGKIAEANHKLAVAAAKDTYHEQMEQVFSDLKTELTPEQLKSNHNRCKNRALEQFKEQRKMGEPECLEKYRLELEQFIETDYKEYKDRNENLRTRIVHVPQELKIIHVPQEPKIIRVPEIVRVPQEPKIIHVGEPAPQGSGCSIL